MRYAVVYNPKAGGGYTKASLQTMLKKASIVPDAWLQVGELQSKIKPYCKKDHCILSIGGDGTHAAVARYVVPSAAVLAPLPGGTLNHFVRDLGIARDLEVAISKLPTAAMHRIDYATANNILFLNNAGIGLYPRMVQIREKQEKNVGKWPAIVISIVRSVIEYRVLQIKISEKTSRTSFVFVGNNEYIFPSGKRENLTGGKLFVVAVAASTRRQFVLAALSLLLGGSYNIREITTQECRISSVRKHRVVLSHDGEVSRVRLPIDFIVHPKQLRVLL